MEVSVKISDIKIPEGNVEKIQETDTGRVLWEKYKIVEIKPLWTIKNTTLFGSFFDYGYNDEYIDEAQKAAYGFIRTISRFPSKSGGNLFAGYIVGSDFYGGNWRNIDMYKRTSIMKYLGKKYPIRITYSGYKSVPGQPYVDSTVVAVPDITDDTTGLILLKERDTSTYFFMKYCEKSRRVIMPEEYKLDINSTPIKNNSVSITYSPERKEYLVTGLNKGSCLVPVEFNSLTPVTYTLANKDLRYTIWVSDKNMYYGATGINGYVYFSTDGLTWDKIKVLNTGNVLRVEYQKKRKRLCAISNNSAEVAISRDGYMWDVKTAPFSNALASIYDEDDDYLCVLDNKRAYLTSDFKKWEVVNIPTSKAVNFKDIAYMGRGVFCGYDTEENITGNSMFYILSLHHEIE